MTEYPKTETVRRIVCYDCEHVWHDYWALDTECPNCGRGFTAPETEEYTRQWHEAGKERVTGEIKPTELFR